MTSLERSRRLFKEVYQEYRINYPYTLYTKNIPETAEASTLALQLAILEATDLRHNYIGTEHLLLGLMGIPEISRVLEERQGITRPKFRTQIEYIIGCGDSIPQLKGMVLVPASKHAIEAAIDTAILSRENTLSPRHMLAGVLKREEGMAANVLEALGVRPSSLYFLVSSSRYLKTRSI